MNNTGIQKEIEFISIDLNEFETSTRKKPVARRVEGIKDKYIEFYSVMLPNRKTPIVAVYNKISKEVIGEIRWYPPWRQFCFFPEDETVYHDGCLIKINECIAYLKKFQEVSKYESS